MWISGQSNIAGNEKPDNIAKFSHSASKAITIPGFYYTDAKKFIKNHTTPKFDNNIGQNKQLNLMKSKCQYSHGLHCQISLDNKKQL